MRVGVISCPAETALRAIAATMASYHVHAVVVEGLETEASSETGGAWGIVSDSDLARAAAEGKVDATAGELVSNPALMIDAGAPLRRAAEVMSANQSNHLLVSSPTGERPVGIISTLDLASALAWGRS